MSSQTSPSPAPKKRLNASYQLGRAAWRTIRLNKSLLRLSLAGIGAELILFGLYLAIILALIPSITGKSISFESDFSSNLIYYVISAVYLFVAYAVVNFFKGAITHGSFQQFDGTTVTSRQSMQAASKKSQPLFAFSGLQATVGIVLNIIHDRAPLGGAIAALIGDLAWRVATMFAIPVVMDGKETRPIKVVKASATTLKNTWGESLFIGISLGAIQVVATLLGVAIAIGSIVLSIATTTWLYAIIGLGLVIIGSIVFSALMSAVYAVVMAAIYRYATTGNVPSGFDDELIRNSFKPKQTWFK